MSLLIINNDIKIGIGVSHIDYGHIYDSNNKRRVCTTLDQIEHTYTHGQSNSQTHPQTRTGMYAHNSRAHTCRQTNMQHAFGQTFDLGSKKCDTGLQFQT